MPDCTPEAVTRLLADDIPEAPPAGFVELEPVGNFESLTGRLYARPDGAAGMVMGFRCNRRHINAHQTCHGGMLATFADMVAYATRVQADLRAVSVPTVSLALDYLKPVVFGDWVEGRAELVRKGGRLIVSRVTLTVGEEPVLIATSTNVRGAEDPPGAERIARVMSGD